MYKSLYSGLVMDECTTLSTITESDKTGLRLLKSNPETHGDIGEDAVDLSTQTLNSTTSGATGDFSFAIGKNTTAKGLYSTALGVSNIGHENTVLEVGIGDNITPENALEIYLDGSVIFPSLTPDLIQDSRSLITKEYFESNSSSDSELQKITEGSNTGWRLLGVNPDNYGDIGAGAVDLSYSNRVDDYGATGTNSFAIGNRNKASGYTSFAGGDSSTADDNYCFAFGQNARAIGYYGHIAIGRDAYASNTQEACVAIGKNAHCSAGSSMALGEYVSVTGSQSVSLGFWSSTASHSSCSVGHYAKSTGSSAHAFGKNAEAHGSNSSSYGHTCIATANYSAAYGFSTNINSEYGTSIGKFNTGTETDTTLEVGIGIDDDNRANGLVLYNDGRLHAPTLQIADITDSKCLVTKEYAVGSVANVGAGETRISEMVQISQADYDALGAGRPADKLYIING